MSRKNSTAFINANRSRNPQMFNSTMCRFVYRLPHDLDGECGTYEQKLIYAPNYGTTLSGFGGLEVACRPFAGSDAAETVGFLGRKNPQHAFLRHIRGHQPPGPYIQHQYNIHFANFREIRTHTIHLLANLCRIITKSDEKCRRKGGSSFSPLTF